MAKMLVTLDEAKDHLRIDNDDDDADLTNKILAASAAVRNYLKSASPYELDSDGDLAEDSNGDPIVLMEVHAAVLLMLGELYRYREPVEERGTAGQWGYGYLSYPVMALLYPLRDPALG